VAKLILLRHGKSDWKADPGGDDRLRPLSRRGERGARLMGRFLVETGNVPELAITSPTRRAEDTLRIAQLAGGWQCEVRRSEALYSGGALGVIGEVAAVEPVVETLLIVSHEPTCSETIALLAGGGRVGFPTAAMACIELEEGSPSGPSGSLTWLVTPRLWHDDRGSGGL
jgi:phosphohistidine phosphatase